MPLDSLSFDALVLGLGGVSRGALSLYSAIDDAAGSTEGSLIDAGSSSEPAPAQR